MVTEIIVPTFADSEIYFHNPVKCKGHLCYWHIHDECEFIMVTAGKEYLYANEDDEFKYVLEEGDIIFVNSRVPHRTRSFDDTHDVLLQTTLSANTNNSYKYLYRYINYASSSVVLFKKGTEINTQLTECFNKIIEENTLRNKSYDLFIKSYVVNIFALLHRNDVIKNPQEHFNLRYINKIIPILDYVNENYSENISLEYVSSILNVNKSHFCRIFKQATNVPFIQYVNFVRTYNAAKLLLRTDKTISEISEETGFSSQSYFAKEFKNNIGCTPNTYKKMKFKKS